MLWMKTLAVRRAAAATGLVAAACLWAAAMPAAHAEDHDVQTTVTNRFEPAEVEIAVGDRVVWTNNGGVNHTVTANSANWDKDDEIALATQSTSHRFDRAGTYTYFCRTHGTAMSGRVVVVGAPRPSPKPSAKPSPRPSARPSPTGTQRSPDPEPSRSAASSPPVSLSATPVPSGTPVPPPSVAPSPPDLRPDPPPSDYLGSGGISPSPPTGREMGLPALVAALFLVGVVVAEVRTLLATSGTTPTPPPTS